MESMTMMLQPFTLILSRMSPMFLAVGLSPLGRYPAMVRLLVLVILSISITNLTTDSWTPLSNHNWLTNLALEWGLGMLMMLSFQLSFAAIQIMGRVLDMQIGFAAAGVIDPISSNNDPLLGHILTLFATLAIFLTNTHHDILAIILETFKIIPPGSWNGQFLISNILAFFFTQLSFALILLGPIVMGLWLLDIFNGFIAKTMPQMNVYFVMLPLKIGVGILMLSVAVKHMKPILLQMFEAISAWFRLGWIA